VYQVKVGSDGNFGEKVSNAVPEIHEHACADDIECFYVRYEHSKPSNYTGLRVTGDQN
jgi:hypothetical protein